MALSLVQDVAAENLNLNDVKAYLKVQHTDEDDFISRLISFSRQSITTLTGHSFVEQEWQQTQYVLSQQVQLLRLPCREIISVSAQNNAHNWDILSDGYHDALKGEGRMVFDEAHQHKLIRVAYKTGYDTVPNALEQAQLHIIAHFYENRLPLDQVSFSKITPSINEILSHYIQVRL